MARKLFSTFLALMVLVALAGCGQNAEPAGSPEAGSDTAAAGSTDAEAPQVVVLTPYLASVTTAEMVAAFEEAGQERGWQVTVVDTKGDFGALASRFEDVIAKKVDAVVLGMADPLQLGSQIETAHAAGIPVFGGDAGYLEGMVLNVTSDNKAMSRQVSQHLLESIGGQGQVVVLTHRPHHGVRARTEAFEELLTEYPEVKVKAEYHVEVPGPLESARKIVENVLTANPQEGSIAAIWAGWDEPAIGAVQALQAAGRTEIKVVGIDGTSQAADLIQQGSPLVATVKQDFAAMATILAEQIERVLGGETVTETELYAPSHLLTKETLSE